MRIARRVALAAALVWASGSLAQPAAAQAPAAQFAPPTGLATAPANGLLIHQPREPSTTTANAVVHVLGRTAAGATVRVGGEAVTVQRTGVFARDGIALQPGANTVLVEALMPDGKTRFTQTLEVERLSPPPAAPEAAASAPAAIEPLPAALYAAGPEGAALTHGVHEVRLGGPFLAELPAGTLLMVNGRTATHYRVALAPDTTVWAPRESLAPAPAGTVQPWASFTSLSVEGGTGGDTVSIPVPAGLPYAIRAVTPQANGSAQLELDLFGAHLATTWITHRASARLVREVSVEQPADGRLRVRIALHGRLLWGWRVEHNGSTLQVTVQAPPALHARSPLRGLRIALEPGHGGPTNLGAVGATGVPEKDVNRWTVEALKAELESAGARVQIVREGDENPNLAERAARVAASDAQLFISVHANSVDTSRGVLRVQGASAYYRHAHSRDLAAAIQRRMLEQTGLADFGLVGAFNYLPIRRITHTPAVLVEQAFMSHPADEAQMLDASFRARTAKAVRLGVEDFLRAALAP
ncbi:MAG: N-acetylmuramoyl-L-alanine amidase [Ideonella sp.]|nr:N-acetylmuramoyl-L-alanine amidase [Ideonella sp.]